MSGTLTPLVDISNCTTMDTVISPANVTGTIVFWMGIGVVGFIGISGLWRLISPSIADLMNRWRRSS